jgi:hypothetical protein
MQPHRWHVNFVPRNQSPAYPIAVAATRKEAGQVAHDKAHHNPAISWAEVDGSQAEGFYRVWDDRPSTPDAKYLYAIAVEECPDPATCQAEMEIALKAADKERYPLVSGGPVYLALNDTDNSTAYVVRFEDETAYQRWYEALGDNEEPFGFQGQWGLAYAILTPQRALEILGVPIP